MWETRDIFQLSYKVVYTFNPSDKGSYLTVCTRLNYLLWIMMDKYF